jgi:hypothetical protein
LIHGRDQAVSSVLICNNPGQYDGSPPGQQSASTETESSKRPTNTDVEPGPLIQELRKIATEARVAAARREAMAPWARGLIVLTGITFFAAIFIQEFNGIGGALFWLLLVILAILGKLGNVLEKRADAIKEAAQRLAESSDFREQAERYYSETGDYCYVKLSRNSQNL